MAAHGNHGHPHTHAHSHSQGEAREHSHCNDKAESHAHSHGEHSHCDHKADGACDGSSPAAKQQQAQQLPAGCGHDHGHRDASNPAHRALDWLYGALRLTSLAAWLEGSVPATLAKVGLLALAAGASWAAGSPAAAAAAGGLAPVWPQVASGALAGAYFFAGVPAGVQLTYDLTSGNVDTHVLMTLAALGTLLTGHGFEVNFDFLCCAHVLQKGGNAVPP